MNSMNETRSVFDLYKSWGVLENLSFATLLVHSHFGQLAIGGTEINRAFDCTDLKFEGEREYWEEIGTSTLFYNRGWKTHFDQGCLESIYGYNRSVLFSAIYAEGQGTITQGYEDGDMWVKHEPQLYILVRKIRMSDKKRGGDSYFSLEGFDFEDPIERDGRPLMTLAADMAASGKKKHEFKIRHRSLTLKNCSKKSLPVRARVLLGKTVKETSEILQRNFGQGAAFFKHNSLMGGRRRKRPQV